MELKPCPFCEGKAECRDRAVCDEGPRLWAVRCTACGVGTVHYGTEAEAARAWNARTYDLRDMGPACCPHCGKWIDEL